MLRRRFQQITDNPDRTKHRTLLESLRTVHPHTVKVLTEPDDDLRYNCVLYAFEVERDSELIDLVLACPEEIHTNTDFVGYLIDKGDLVECKEPISGALVVYFHERRIQHIGRVISETRIASKWGVGELYEHDVFDVPERYGDDVRYFNGVGRDGVVERFVEFAEEKGVSFAENDG